MKIRILLVIAFIIAFCGSGYSQMTAIKAGHLIDPANGSTASNVVILVEDAKIMAVGADVKIPNNVNVIDLSEQFVLPGLFDCHVHLCASAEFESDDLETTMKEIFHVTVDNTTPYRALQGVANAWSMLEAGFTTVRDMGNAGHYADVELKKAINNGLIPGPTVFVSGKIIAPFGGQFHLNYENIGLGNNDYIYADSHDEIRKAIRMNIHYGADIIKIVVDDQLYIYSVEDLRFIIDEAAKAGFKVAAHCITLPGARNAVEAGVFSIEHGFVMDDEVLKEAKRKGVWLVGTDFTDEALRVAGILDFYPLILDRLERAYKIGVKMAYGSDLVWHVPGYTRGSASLSLIDTWVKAGIPAKDILHALTTNAALLLGVENERGAIKEGLAADIIATPHNPIDNINALKTVEFVMKDGKVIKHE